MRLYPAVKHEVHLADFIVDRNAPMEIMKLFYEWLIVNEHDQAASEIYFIIRSNGGSV